MKLWQFGVLVAAGALALWRHEASVRWADKWHRADSTLRAEAHRTDSLLELAGAARAVETVTVARGATTARRALEAGSRLDSAYRAAQDTLRPALPDTLLPIFDRLGALHRLAVDTLTHGLDTALVALGVARAGWARDAGLLATVTGERDRALALAHAVRPRSGWGAGVVVDQAGGVSLCVVKTLTSVFGLQISGGACFRR